MKRAVKNSLPVLLAASVAIAAGCMEQRDDRNYVQTNVVLKSLFEGEWYHTHTIIDNDQESTYAMAFRGSVSSDEGMGYYAIARVRFVIDEDWLYAFRSYPMVANADRTPTGERGMDTYEPMGAWPIESHFDIVRRYNTESGEVLNVIEENDQDRPWYERQYMRVDWAGNELLDGYNFNWLDVYDPLGIVTREPASNFVQEGSEFPEAWQPSFDFTPVEEPPRDSWEWEFWDRYGQDQLYHFTFVTQEIWQPGVYPLLYDWALPSYLYGQDVTASASLVSVRYSFLRVPEEQQYEPLPYPEDQWEQFGAWRVEQPTYIWGDLPDEESGLSNFYGQTDALNYWGGRHNIWRRTYDLDDEGRRVAIPIEEREVQPVVYTLSERFPAWLVQPSFGVVGEWNGTFMEAVRATQGRPLPPAVIADSSCSTDRQCLDQYGESFPWTSCRIPHPDEPAYVDGSTGQCTRRYNPFLTPNDTLFVECGGEGQPECDPGTGPDFDCYVVNAEGNPVTDPGLTLRSFDDASLAEARSWRFVGSECALTLRNNTCDNPVELAVASERRPACAENSDLCCDQMGDLRFNFFAHNDQVGVAWGGVSQPLLDPLTGEMIQANCNVSALSVEGAMTYVGWYFELYTSEDEDIELSYMIGEDVRELMENSSYAIPPVTPNVPPHLSTDQVPLAGMSGFGAGSDMPEDARLAARNLPPRLQRSLEQAWALRGREGRSAIYSDRMSSLAGSRRERMLYSGPDGLRSLGVMPDSESASPIEDMLDEASLFRDGGGLAVERELAALRDRMSRANMCFSADSDPTSFIDVSYIDWLRDLEGLDDQQRAIAVGRSYFRGVMLHELGHSIGARHNFAGSLDYANYHDQYYEIDERFPLPTSEDYDANEDGSIDYEELAQFNTELTQARQDREDAGIARWHNASIMEYMPRISNDLQPLGRYDRAFAHFIYGNSIETYTLDYVESRMRDTESRRAWMARPDRTPRGHDRYFTGGETCRIDRDTDSGIATRFHHEDCPYGVLWNDPATRRGDACEGDSDCEPFGMVCREVSMRSDEEGDEPRRWCVSPRLPEGQVVGQICAENPRADQTQHREDLPGVCLGYRDSWDAYFDMMLRDESADDIAAYPISYRFCSDERTTDISWCNRFDEGESFREVMANYRDDWERSYPFYFRRYRADFQGATFFSTFADISKIMAHFYYRYFYEELYRVEGDVWVDSMTDHLAGAAAGMNFLAEVIAQPDVGSYAYDPDTFSYSLVASGELGASDLDVPIGLGRYQWSSYQDGPFGIFRMERQGSYLDKLYALYALARRDWGYSYSYDERFWINFYSMFPYEMSQLFGGLILDDATLYGPRVCEQGQEHPFLEGETCERTSIFYQDLWRGPFLFAGDVEDARGNPYEELYASMPAIGGGNSDLLRTWAVIFSLAEFPVFYDPNYEQQMYMFVEGTGESFDVRDCTEYPDDPYCLEEGVDYARYFSDRYNLNFISYSLENEFDWEPESINTSFVIIDRARQLSEEIEACEAGLPTCPVAAGPARDAALEEWRIELERAESFILSVLDIQGNYGISSWL